MTYIIILGTSDGEMDLYKIAKLREKKHRDLNNVICVNSEDQKVLVKGEDIKKSRQGVLHQRLDAMITM